MTQAPSRCALLCAGLLAVATAQAADTRSSPRPPNAYGWQGAGNYITGAQLADVEQRIRSQAPLNADSNRAFQKALCTIRLANHTYREVNTKGSTEYLAAQALALSATAQQNGNPGQMAPLPGTPRQYADHWARIADLKQAADGKQCVVTQLECAEVALAGAEYESREGYGQHRRHGTAWLKQADQLMNEGDAVVAACAVPTAGNTEAETFSLDTDALFAFDSARMTTAGQRRIDEFVVQLPKFSNGIDRIDIVGHTDRIGGNAYNQQLSEQRAEAVKAALLQRVPKLADVVHTAGLGETEPVVDCPGSKATAALKSCLQPNRRVTVTVVGTSSK